MQNVINNHRVMMMNYHPLEHVNNNNRILWYCRVIGDPRQILRRRIWIHPRNPLNLLHIVQHPGRLSRLCREQPARHQNRISYLRRHSRNRRIPSELYLILRLMNHRLIPVVRRIGVYHQPRVRNSRIYWIGYPAINLRHNSIII